MIKFKEIVENFSEYEQIYTDGSKQGERVGAAALVPNGAQKSFRLPDKSSIYSAELRALLSALELIEGSIKKHFIIFSDSLFCNASSVKPPSRSSFGWRNPFLAY